MSVMLCKRSVSVLAALRPSVCVSAHFSDYFIFPLPNFRPPQPVDIVALRRAHAVHARLAACVVARATPASQYEQMTLDLDFICAGEGIKSL